MFIRIRYEVVKNKMDQYLQCIPKFALSEIINKHMAQYQQYILTFVVIAIIIHALLFLFVINKFHKKLINYRSQFKDTKQHKKNEQQYKNTHTKLRRSARLNKCSKMT